MLPARPVALRPAARPATARSRLSRARSSWGSGSGGGSGGSGSGSSWNRGDDEDGPDGQAGADEGGGWSGGGGGDGSSQGKGSGGKPGQRNWRGSQSSPGGGGGGGGSGGPSGGGGGGGIAGLSGFLQSLPSFSVPRGDDGSPNPVASLAARLRACAADGRASPLAAAALAPVVAWAVTWGLTAGLAHLADAAMGGMCGVARLLFPALPVRGVSHEDVAVSLVKSLAAGTADDATWAPPGMWIPSWALQALMRLMFGTAVASTSLAASLAQTGPWMALCGASQAALFALCLLVALPIGSGLQSLAQRFDSGRESGSSYGSSAAAGSPGGGGGGGGGATALALKLAAALAWPCLSAAAVGGSLAAKAAAAPPFALSVARVAAAAAAVSMLLTLALTAARFGREVARGAAGDDAVVNFGLQVGLLCGAQAGLNGLQLLLGLAGGAASPRDVVAALVSSAVLARLSYTTWLMREEARPAVWLRMLRLDTLLAR